MTSLVDARKSLQDILQLNLLPFWRRVADTSVGEGYSLNHDTNGRYRGPSNLSLISQARTAWFFARLIRLGLAEPADRARADRGYHVLANRFLDADHGGYFWQLERTTLQPSVPDKLLYGQSFPLMAMAEYALATGSSEAARLAREHFDVLDRHMWNIIADNHVEARYRDWSSLPPGAVDVRGQPPDARTHNTRMHFMGAVSVHHELDPSPEVGRRLARLVELIEGSIVRLPHPLFRERDRVRPSAQRYGHDMEAIQLLFQARARLGRCRTPPAVYGEIVDGVLRFAEDRGLGGIRQGGPIGTVSTTFDRDDWVQAESLLALAEFYRHGRRPERAAAMFRTLDWIGRWQVDWANGSWFSRISADGVPGGPKAGPYGGPFHTCRAVLGTLQILDAVEDGLPAGGCTVL